MSYFGADAVKLYLEEYGRCYPTVFVHKLELGLRNAINLDERAAFNAQVELFLYVVERGSWHRFATESTSSTAREGRDINLPPAGVALP